ncbi:hypothetical protein V7x_52400 [Crateriforma conspicua]|uniref:Uncharacterized protein n=1 Tax=Crateriforma conspicua TaxID=2527996 RepID=A0A5C6FGR5_9PLAN|nr:hypothetical protein V7x_52400 [Crateriforma conspicua]
MRSGLGLFVGDRLNKPLSMECAGCNDWRCCSDRGSDFGCCPAPLSSEQSERFAGQES